MINLRPYMSYVKYNYLTPFIVLILLTVMACAPTTSSRYREGSNVGQETSMTVKDEERLTKEALPKLQKDFPPAKNPEMQKYISDLGMKIVKANNLEGKPYHYTFTVVDVPDVNAFAMPAGAIFVTAPLIAMTTNEAELAGVVAHEIGHVVARHTAERMYAMEKAQNKTWLYAAGGAVVGAAAGFGIGTLVCPKDDKECLARAAMLGGAAGVGGGLLLQQYKFLVNSREDEMEADRIGFRLAVGAGYDKHQVGKFYERLLEIEKNAQKTGSPLAKSLSQAFSTHPPSAQRVEQMRELTAQSPEKKGIVSSQEFAQAKKIAVELQKSKAQ